LQPDLAVVELEKAIHAAIDIEKLDACKCLARRSELLDAHLQRVFSVCSGDATSNGAPGFQILL